MADATGGLGNDRARRIAMLQDQLALWEIVAQRVVCDATGKRLDAGDAVAMTVAVNPGVSRLAVVSGAHSDSGSGALSAADPDVDPDVLDGRKLFTRKGADPQPTGRSRSAERRVRGGANAAVSSAGAKSRGVSGDRYLGPIRVSDLRGPFDLTKFSERRAKRVGPSGFRGGSGLILARQHAAAPRKLAGHSLVVAVAGPNLLTKQANGPQRLAAGRPA
jgi:hypothetical protein